MNRGLRYARQTLIVVLTLVPLVRGSANEAAVGAAAQVPYTSATTVRGALQLCARARRRAGHVKLYAATPRLWVHGYFVRVIGNGYIVMGEAGELYDSSIPTHGSQERIVRPGGLNLGVPLNQVPHGIPTGRWILVHGTLRCYQRAGEILFVDGWRSWRR